MHCTFFISERNFLIPVSPLPRRDSISRPTTAHLTDSKGHCTITRGLRGQRIQWAWNCVCARTYARTHTHMHKHAPTHTWKPEDSPQYIGVHCLFPSHQSGKGFLTTNAHSCMPMLKPSSSWGLCSNPSHLLKEIFFFKKKALVKMAVVMHTFNPSIWEPEAGKAL